jgi:tetratricopeptide (TPR) repeat protein
MASSIYRYSIAASILAFSAIWAFHAYKSDDKLAPLPTPVQVVLPSKVQTLSGSYLASRHASMSGDSSAASQFLGIALKFAPQNKELTSQAVRSLILAGDHEQAVALAREKTALEVKTPAIYLTLFTEEARQGNWELAASHLSQIRAYGLQAVTLPFLQSWVTLAETEKVVPPRSPLNLNHSYYQAFLHYQTALLYDVAGNTKAAASYFDRMLRDLALVPERFIEVAVQFHLRQGDETRAEEIYTAYMQATADGLRLTPETADEAMQRLGQNLDQPWVASPQDGIAEVMLSMANLLHSEMVVREAMIYARLALAIRPDFPDALYTLGEVQEDAQKPEDALTTYSEIPVSHPLYRRAALRRAFLLDETAKTDQAIALLEEMARTMSQPVDVHMTLADILRNQQKYAQAAEQYSHAIDALDKVKPRHWPLFYTRGISYERAGLWDKAEGDFLRALSLEPDQPDVKNYLAYSWLLMGKNFAKATEMLEQASASRPEDGHILDSLAWAYHLSGQADKSVDMIERAVEMMPHDPTVNDHYGDILWKAGRRTEARYQWERALAFKPEPKDRVAIEKKLRSGLPEPTQETTTSTASSAERAAPAAHP